MAYQIQNKPLIIKKEYGESQYQFQINANKNNNNVEALLITTLSTRNNKSKLVPQDNYNNNNSSKIFIPNKNIKLDPINDNEYDYDYCPINLNYNNTHNFNNNDNDYNIAQNISLRKHNNTRIKLSNIDHINSIKNLLRKLKCDSDKDHYSNDVINKLPLIKFLGSLLFNSNSNTADDNSIYQTNNKKLREIKSNSSLYLNNCVNNSLTKSNENKRYSNEMLLFSLNNILKSNNIKLNNCFNKSRINLDCKDKESKKPCINDSNRHDKYNSNYNNNEINNFLSNNNWEVIILLYTLSLIFLNKQYKTKQDVLNCIFKADKINRNDNRENKEIHDYKNKKKIKSFFNIIKTKPSNDAGKKKIFFLNKGKLINTLDNNYTNEGEYLNTVNTDIKQLIDKYISVFNKKKVSNTIIVIRKFKSKLTLVNKLISAVKVFFNLKKYEKYKSEVSIRNKKISKAKIIMNQFFRKKKKYLTKIILIQSYYRMHLTKIKYIDDIELYRSQLKTKRMREEFDRKNKIYKQRLEAVRVIEKFWQNILDRNELIKMWKDAQNMPEDCRKLFLKFIRLRHQTRNLKLNLGKIKNQK